MPKQIQLIPKNMVSPIARVLDKESRELYQEAQAQAREKFGEDNRAYRTIMSGINTRNITGSQFFWNTNLNQYLPKAQRVISLEDMQAINDQDESFSEGFYTDVPEIVLRTDILSGERNKHILTDLVKQVRGEGYEFSSENPLRISGLELVEDENLENDYGLLLRMGENTKIMNDERFACSNNGKQIPFGEKTKPIYTKEYGLSRVCLDWDGYLISENDNLGNSYDDGRVVIIEEKKE